MLSLVNARQAKRIAPETMSMQFADTLYKVYYTASWPLMSFPAFTIPEVLHIWLLSKNLGIRSPVPKLPLVYPGQDYQTKHFGWSGSIGFSEAALISKKLISKEPSSIPETAVFVNFF